MFGQRPAQRAIAVAAVVLLHILLMWLLLRATSIHLTLPPAFRELPITVYLQPAPKPKLPPAKPEQKKKVTLAPPVKRATGIAQPPAPAAPQPAQPYNGLMALGRYLNNCSSGNYEQLSSLEWAHCLGDQWPDPGERPLLLGAQAPSIWKTQKDQQKAPVQPFETQCPQNSPNSNLGLPCYNFGKGLDKVFNQ